MCPGDHMKDMVFHQDSAFSHSAYIIYLRQQNVNLVTPEEQIPKSLDAATMDFDVWGILKRRLQNSKLYTLAGLKREFNEEWKNNKKKKL